LKLNPIIASLFLVYEKSENGSDIPSVLILVSQIIAGEKHSYDTGNKH
jgi:hypothetical protein